VELTRPRGSVNCNLQKHLAKHAIAARVQRFVGPPQIVTRYPSSTGTGERGEQHYQSTKATGMRSRAKRAQATSLALFLPSFQLAKSAQRRSSRGRTQLRYTQVVDEKPADSARVQRFVGPPQIVTRYPSSTGTGERGEQHYQSTTATGNAKPRETCASDKSRAAFCKVFN
jgi:hypothetical protein